MQTLRTTVFPCYAGEDREIAHRLGEFLARGAEVAVFLEEGEIGPGEDLLGKAREGRMADVIVALFSRSSMPRRWSRSEWEDPLVKEPEAEGVRIAFVRCDDCIPPRVLQPCFDVSTRPSEGLRLLKRWVRSSGASFEPPPTMGTGENLDWLGIAVADRAGVETVDRAEAAYEFARQYREDFDEIFRLECKGRSLAAVAGDLAAQMGLRLEGDLSSNLSRLWEFISARRFLLLMEGGPVEDLVITGRSSVLVTRECGAETHDLLHEAQKALANASAISWTELCHFARQGRRITREDGRLAECFEMMEQWHEAALAREELEVLDESAREMVWILEQWGHMDQAQVLEHRRAAQFGRQLALPF